MDQVSSRGIQGSSGTPRRLPSRMRPARLTFVGGMEAQIRPAAESRSEEQQQQEEEGAVTIHVAGAEGSASCISP